MGEPLNLSTMTTLREHVGSVPLLQGLYTRGLAFRYGSSGMPWIINGEEYRIAPEHRHRLAHEYDAPVARYLRERIRPGDTCVDIGANVGVYVLQMARWAQGGLVLAFEPNPEARAVLQQHILWNRIENRVRVVPLAVSDHAGVATLHADGADGMARLDVPNKLLSGHTTAHTVSVVTLDDYCRDHGLTPDVVLIDIEGFELAALRGGGKALRSAHTVVVEMHPDVWTHHRDEMADWIREMGYNIRALTGQTDPLRDHGLVGLERH